MYQNYYEQVARRLVDAIRQSNLPARVRANDDHSITLELFGIYLAFIWHLSGIYEQSAPLTA